MEEIQSILRKEGHLRPRVQVATLLLGAVPLHLHSLQDLQGLIQDKKEETGMKEVGRGGRVEVEAKNRDLIEEQIEVGETERGVDLKKKRKRVVRMRW